MENEGTRLAGLVEKVVGIAARHVEGADMDAAFDGGEFSGPASDRAMRRDVVAALAAEGFTPSEFVLAVERMDELTEDAVAAISLVEEFAE